MGSTQLVRQHERAMAADVHRPSGRVKNVSHKTIRTIDCCVSACCGWLVKHLLDVLLTTHLSARAMEPSKLCAYESVTKGLGHGRTQT